MADIILEGVTKVFRDGTEAVSSLDLEISDGTLFVLVGPSGCGKTTVLRMVAGLEDVSEGDVWIGDHVINSIPPGERDVAMVFQNYALYPHMTVFQNMALSLKIRKVDKGEMQRRVREAARILRIEELLDKRPRELSGGERQRVAMGRAIVRQPQAFLMDEPLSNLDAKLRVQMRSEILRIQQSLRVTTLYVTHDQTEAMTLGDQVAVMRRGVLQQVADPQTLYKMPANLFVAGFIGSPAMNLVEAKLVRSDGHAFVEFGPHKLRVPPEVRSARPGLSSFHGRRIVLGIRPEDFEDPAFARNPSADGALPVQIDLREEMGSDVYLHFSIDAPPVLTDDTRDLAVDQGSDALKDLEDQVSARRSSFVARVHPGSDTEVSEARELIVDTRKLHFFDPRTGNAIYEDLDRVSPEMRGARSSAGGS